MYAQTEMLRMRILNKDRLHRIAQYRSACNRGQRGQLWSMLTGRSRRLLALQEVEDNCLVHTHRHAIDHTVPIAQICGSESRAGDFDRDFNPLNRHTQERWLRIAEAREKGRGLPAVDLVQVRELYFVRDGHHRISVARALGQTDIDARVEVWQVEGPLPQEARARLPGRGSGRQPGGTRLFLARTREFATFLKSLLTPLSAKGRTALSGMAS
jgi:hypothetical protein